MAEPGAETSFEIDERLYPLEAVQNAAYAFTDRAYVRVEPAGEGRLKVSLSFKTAPPPNGAARGEFDNELLHQALRLRVSEANQKIREFIVTKALVSAHPAEAVAAALPASEPCAECAAEQGAPGAGAPPAGQVDEALEKEIDRLLAEIESGDAASDPLGVTVPWEEKFGAKAPAPAPKDAPAAAPPDGAAAARGPKPKAKGGAKSKKR